MRQTNRFFFCGHTSGKVAEFFFLPTSYVTGLSLSFSAVPVV